MPHLLLLVHPRNDSHWLRALWHIVDVLNLLDNMLGFFVGQVVLAHELLDETQLIGTLVVY